MYLNNFFILSTLIIGSLALSAYDPTLGNNLCRLTVASYCKPAKVKDWTCKPCMDSPIKLSNVNSFYNSTGDVLGIIGISATPKAICKFNKYIVLVFRGTVPWEIKNWIQDIDFVKMNFPACNNGCQVHRGFYKDYLEIAPSVLARHSLGGALATHAAVSLVSQGINVDTLYTFGSPRVGDNKFSTWFQAFVKNTKVRVTHGRDPVPHLPPADWGFTHVPHEIFYKAFVRQGYVTCNDSGLKEDPNCSDKYKADVIVTDHVTYYDIDFTGIVLTCQ